MSTNYDLTEQQLNDGSKRCIENVQNLLDSAKLLLSNEKDSHHQYALGLYVYAIEECGKAQILRNYLKENNNGTYSIPDAVLLVEPA